MAKCKSECPTLVLYGLQTSHSLGKQCQLPHDQQYVIPLLELLVLEIQVMITSHLGLCFGTYVILYMHCRHLLLASEVMLDEISHDKVT